MAEPVRTKKPSRLEARAERIRQAFLARPGFKKLVAASKEAEDDGRFVTDAEVRQKHEIGSTPTSPP